MCVNVLPRANCRGTARQDHQKPKHNVRCSSQSLKVSLQTLPVLVWRLCWCYALPGNARAHLWTAGEHGLVVQPPRAYVLHATRTHMDVPTWEAVAQTHSRARPNIDMIITLLLFERRQEILGHLETIQASLASSDIQKDVLGRFKANAASLALSNSQKNVQWSQTAELEKET